MTTSITRSEGSSASAGGPSRIVRSEVHTSRRPSQRLVKIVWERDGVLVHGPQFQHTSPLLTARDLADFIVPQLEKWAAAAAELNMAIDLHVTEESAERVHVVVELTTRRSS